MRSSPADPPPHRRADARTPAQAGWPYYKWSDVEGERGVRGSKCSQFNPALKPLSQQALRLDTLLVPPRPRHDLQRTPECVGRRTSQPPAMSHSSAAISPPRSLSLALPPADTHRPLSLSVRVQKPLSTKTQQLFAPARCPTVPAPGGPGPRETHRRTHRVP